jgi:hypothetical protein
MRFRSSVVPYAVLFAVTACAPNVHSSAIRGAGYVRVEDVVKHHPLYGQLSQLDDAIAAINLQSTPRQVPLGAAQIAAQTAELNRELRDAQVRANKILAQKQQDYANRESQAVSAALAAAGIHGSGAAAASQMSGASAQQAQQAAQAANSDLMAYQQNVIAQDNAATSTIAKQLQVQAAQKYRAKAEQLQQNETDLSLRLTQSDAASRLAIKMRLSNLALEPAARKQAQDQLAAINAKEAAALDTQRNGDAATLRAYRGELDRQTGDAIRNQVGAIHQQTRWVRNCAAWGRRRCRRTFPPTSRPASHAFTGNISGNSRPMRPRRWRTTTRRRATSIGSLPPFTGPTSERRVRREKSWTRCKSAAASSISRWLFRCRTMRDGSPKNGDSVSS